MLETFDPIQCAHCKSFKNKFFCHRLRSEKIWTLQEIIFTEEIGSCAHGAVYCYLKAKFCSKWKMKNWFWQRSDLFWFFDQFTDCQFCTAFLSHCIAVHCAVYNTGKEVPRWFLSSVKNSNYDLLRLNREQIAKQMFLLLAVQYIAWPT